VLDNIPNQPNLYIDDELAETSRGIIYDGGIETDLEHARECTISIGIDAHEMGTDSLTIEEEFSLLRSDLLGLTGIMKAEILYPLGMETLESGRIIFTRIMVMEPIGNMCSVVAAGMNTMREDKMEYLADFAISGIRTLQGLHKRGYVDGGIGLGSFAHNFRDIPETEPIFTLLMNFEKAKKLPESMPAFYPENPREIFMPSIESGFFCLVNGEYTKRDDLYMFGQLLYRMWGNEGYVRAFHEDTNGHEIGSESYTMELFNFKKHYASTRSQWLAHEDPLAKSIDDYMNTVKSLSPGLDPPYEVLVSSFTSLKDDSYDYV